MPSGHFDICRSSEQWLLATLPSGAFVRPSIRTSVRPYVRPSVRPSVRTSRILTPSLSATVVSFHPSVRQPAYPFACPSVRPSICSSLFSAIVLSSRPFVLPSPPGSYVRTSVYPPLFLPFCKVQFCMYGSQYCCCRNVVHRHWECFVICF